MWANPSGVDYWFHKAGSHRLSMYFTINPLRCILYCEKNQAMCFVLSDRTRTRSTHADTAQNHSNWPQVGFSNPYDGLFPLSSGGFGPVFLGLLYKRDQPPGTILPPVILQVLNLHPDSSLKEQYTSELREKPRRYREARDERNGNTENC